MGTKQSSSDGFADRKSSQISGQKASVYERGHTNVDATQAKGAGEMAFDSGDSSTTKASCKPTPCSSDSKTILSPNAEDILMGRGWSFQKHPGNQNMHRLVEMHKERYSKLSTSGKGDLVKELLRDLKKGGSRFLKRKSDTPQEVWEVASRAEAYEKVCHALRGKVRQTSKAKEVSRPSSGQSVVNHADDGRKGARNPSSRHTSTRVRLQTAPRLDGSRDLDTRRSGVPQSSKCDGPQQVASHNMSVTGIAASPMVASSSSADDTTGEGPQQCNERGHNSLGTPDPTRVVEGDNQGKHARAVEEDLRGVHPAIRMALIAYLGRKHGTKKHYEAT